MLFHLRSNMILYYRLFFIALFLLSGISAVGIVLLENYAGINIIFTESEIDTKALHITLILLGIFGIATAFIMIFLMRERRSSAPDRRHKSTPTESIGRRINADRRSDEPRSVKSQYNPVSNSTI